MAEMSRALDQCCRGASAVCPPPLSGAVPEDRLGDGLEGLGAGPHQLGGAAGCQLVHHGLEGRPVGVHHSESETQSFYFYSRALQV